MKEDPGSSEKPFEELQIGEIEKKIGSMKAEKAELVIRVKGLEGQVLDVEQSLEMLQTGVAIANYDPEGRVVISYLNETAKELLKSGMKKDTTLEGLPLQEWLEVFNMCEKDGNPLDPENFPMTKAIRTGKPTTPKEINSRKNGEIRSFRVKATPLRNAEGKTTASMTEFEDITLEKDYEQRLERSDRALKDILKHIRKTLFLIFQKDPLTIIYVSPSVEKILGQKEESLRQDPIGWTKTIHPEDKTFFEDKELVEKGEKHIQEYRVVHENGDVHWVQDESFSVEDPQKKISMVYRILTDITSVKEAALKAEKAWDTAEKNLELFRHRALIANITLQVIHDLKNALNISNLGLISMSRDPQSERNSQRIRTVEKGLTMMGDLIRSFGPLTQNHDPMKIENINPIGVIANIRPIIDSLSSKNILYDINPFYELIRITSMGLERIILNLILNAMQATEETKPITFCTDTVMVPQEDLIQTKHHYPWIQARPGKYFRLVITDEGRGMSPDILAKLYNEQVTTKEKGTGEGSLSIRSALASSGGFLKIESTPGIGTKIEIHLPVVEKSEQLKSRWEKK